MIAGALDQGRTGGFESHHAAKNSGHDLTWGGSCWVSPIPMPGQTSHWSPAEASAVIAWHREAAALETAKKLLNVAHKKGNAKGQEARTFRRRRQLAKAQALYESRSRCIGGQGRKGQRRRGSMRPGRDIDHGYPARMHHRERRCPPRQSGCSMFFALLASFSKETEFRKFVGEAIATARFRLKARRCRIPMLASPCRRARCNCHEARAWIVAVMSCCLVRLSNGGLSLPDETVSRSFPACTQQRICRVPLGPAASTRWLSVVTSAAAAKHCFSLCSIEHPLQIQNLSSFHVTQRTGRSDKVSLRRPQKTSLPLASVSLLALQLYHWSIGFSNVWVAIF